MTLAKILGYLVGSWLSFSFFTFMVYCALAYLQWLGFIDYALH